MSSVSSLGTTTTNDIDIGASALDTAKLAVVCAASLGVGRWFSTIKLPMITGFLLTGILTGPYVLEIFDKSSGVNLKYLSKTSLAWICFIAASEFYTKYIVSVPKLLFWSLKSMAVSMGIICGSLALLRTVLPWMDTLTIQQGISVALLSATVCTCRSPSAIVSALKQLNANGPYCRFVLQIIMIIQFLVLIEWVIACSIASGLAGDGITIWVFVDLLVNLTITGIMGGFVSLFFFGLLHIPFLRLYLCDKIGQKKYLTKETYPQWLRTLLPSVQSVEDFLLACVFAATALALTSLQIALKKINVKPLSLSFEPLLTDVICCFIITNYTSKRVQLKRVLGVGVPLVFVLFFTIAGLSLNVSAFPHVWQFSLCLFALHILATVVSSLLPACSPLAGSKRVMSCLGFFTEGGVSVGLAAEVTTLYPDFGPVLNTGLLCEIALTQTFGPIPLTWAICHAGENNVVDDTQDDSDDEKSDGIEMKTLSSSSGSQTEDDELSV
ncbi:potassium transporter TrkA [Pelomyxa schiedti]|nr:potassium transporter TrkA [Pelomyxa schiedti]